MRYSGGCSIYSLLAAAILVPAVLAAQEFATIEARFITGYRQLKLPEFAYDHATYFGSIQDTASLGAQERFFGQAEAMLQHVNADMLSDNELVHYRVMRYETELNRERVRLERRWVGEGRKMPVRSLYELPHGGEWYRYFVRRITTIDRSPEEILEYGKRDVARVKQETDRIYRESGIGNNATTRPQKDGEAIADKNDALKLFSRTDSIVRRHLTAFADCAQPPQVFAMEWPDAGPNTPPGMYLGRADNAYGKDIFLVNFYGGRYNRRVIEWLYMHEAIPGHHLQASMRGSDSLTELFLYPGNFEGWACYVEYYGKEMGLYTDVYMELGKWEWDLVRSVRVVLDAGIHYYGWTKEEALKYWKEQIPGQDAIAEREVTRVSNWPAQALSYKLGAAYIFDLQAAWEKEHKGRALSAFRKGYLQMGMIPLPVIAKVLINKTI